MDKKIKYNHPEPNWLGWTKWEILNNTFTTICCDCGLAHKFQFRVRKDNRVEWKTKRDKIATKLARKNLKF